MSNKAVHIASAERPAKPKGLHAYLLALVAGSLLPGILAASLAIWWAGNAFRDTSIARLTDTAQTFSRAIESLLEVNIVTLQTLDAVPTTSAGPAASEQVWLDHAGNHLGWDINIATLDNGVVTGVPSDGPVSEVVRRAIATQASAISNLFQTGDGSAPHIAVAVPRGSKSRATQALVMTMTPSTFIRALQQHNADLSGILVAVTDGTGHLVARSRDPERYVGKKVPDWDNLLATGTERGSFHAKTTEGFPVVFAFQRLKGTPGWAVVVGEPLKAFDEQWQRPLIGLAIGGIIAVALALLIGTWISQLILQPIRALAQHSQTVAADQSEATATPVPPSSIAEFEALRQSLDAAETALRRRAEAEKKIADELANSERRYRAVAEAGALVFWRRDNSGAIRSATGWHDLTGQAEEDALGDGWLERVHPDDHGQVTIAWDEATGRAAPLDVEFRVRAATGQWHWVRARGAAVHDAQSGVTEWVGALEDVDARRKAQARVVYMAHHDALTGLANRILLRERLESAAAESHGECSGALLSLDLDRFKEVNDTLGHPTGDALLRAVTERILAHTRAEDLVARLGGDEFSIVQVDTNQPAAASSLANRLITALSEPYELNGQHVIIGVSVGVTLIADQNNRPDQLLKSADLALYRAKSDGRGRFCFFEPEMDHRMQERHRREKDLRRGINAGEFEVHYQPLVNLRTREFVGFEALLRWSHPERGLLQPADFMSELEDTGLDVQLGENALMQACSEAANWPEHLKIAVNISSGQLRSRGLVDAVNAALHASQIKPGRLQIEITENALIDNIDTAMATLLKLKVTGVGIAMDNFGTGYSSLGYLRAFPFDKVKIDRTFLREVDTEKENQAIIKAITGLCGSLGIATTAEGVESRSQLDFLLSGECTEAQGYLFGRPCRSADIPALLDSFNANYAPASTAGKISPRRQSQA